MQTEASWANQSACGSRGLFITFEGPEAAGKSTQTRMLEASLRERGWPVFLTREPGGTQLGESLRNLVKTLNSDEPLVPEAELLLFGASRAQLVAHKIEPRLANGEIVICDRFYDSTTVYQGLVRGLDTSFIQRMHGLTNKGRQPDLTLVLDVGTNTSLDRRNERDPDQKAATDRFEAESDEFHEKVRQGFLQIAREEPQRVRVVQGDRDAETIHAEIKEIIDHALSSIQ